MISIVSGILVLLLTIVAAVALRARNGVEHPLVLLPGIGAAIPLAWTCGAVFGVALIINGLVD